MNESRTPPMSVKNNPPNVTFHQTTAFFLARQFLLATSESMEELSHVFLFMDAHPSEVPFSSP
jgi:hypothetical protein